MNYKLLIIIPVALLLISLASLGLRYAQTGEWFDRSIELKGGTSIDLKLDPSQIPAAKQALAGFNVNIREVRSLSGSGLEIEAAEGPEAILEALQAAGIDTSQSSVRTIGPALGESFWLQTQVALAMAFVLMGIVVFVMFRNPITSVYVILAALSDILITIAFMGIFGIEVSLPAIGALLMLIGYSVDTDILLTTRVTKDEDSLPERVKSAFKTGITMTLTTLAALVALLLTGISPVLSQIASVLIIGLVADIINTWAQNAVLLRMYMEKKLGFVEPKKQKMSKEDKKAQKAAAAEEKKAQKAAGEKVQEEAEKKKKEEEAENKKKKENEKKAQKEAKVAEEKARKEAGRKKKEEPEIRHQAPG